MNLSTKIRYGVRAMLELAIQHKTDQPVMASSIAKKQKLSKKYLEHLLNMLKISGLIKSIRGSKGGYLLTSSPSEITLKDIFIALDGPLSLTQCLEDDEICPSTNRCVTRLIWKEMSDTIENYLSNKTLEDLIDLIKEDQDFACL